MPVDSILVISEKKNEIFEKTLCLENFEKKNKKVLKKKIFEKKIFEKKKYLKKKIEKKINLEKKN